MWEGVLSRKTDNRQNSIQVYIPMLKKLKYNNYNMNSKGVWENTAFGGNSLDSLRVAFDRTVLDNSVEFFKFFTEK